MTYTIYDTDVQLIGILQDIDQRLTAIEEALKNIEEEMEDETAEAVKHAQATPGQAEQAPTGAGNHDARSRPRTYTPKERQ